MNRILNGNTEITINGDDLGIQHGFSVFETFYVRNEGTVFLLDEHVKRLMDSLEFFGFNCELTGLEMKKSIREYISQHQIGNKVFRVTVTFGNRHKNIQSSVLFNQREAPSFEDKAKYGTYITVSKSVRDPEAITVGHKTGNYLDNLLVLQQAAKDGFDDVLFLNTNGKVSETAKGNIFYVKNGSLFTPALHNGLLPGIIRGWLITAAEAEGIDCRQLDFGMNDLMEADGVFVTNSVIGILPVKSIDNCEYDLAKSYGILKQLLNKYENEAWQ